MFSITITPYRKPVTGFINVLTMVILALNLVTRIKLGRRTWCAKHALRLCVGGPMMGGVGALSHIAMSQNQKLNHIIKNHKI